MKISTKGRYALRVMCELAKHPKDQVVSLGEISENQNISRKYLEQIVSILNKAGLLRTVRGFKGGYSLIKDADKYTVYEILTVTEGSLAPVSCLDYPENDCPRASECQTLFVWQGLYDKIKEYLESINLIDILEHEISDSFMQNI